MILGRTGVIASSYLPQAAGNGYYRSITLDQPASDLTDFPVLFTGTYTYLKTTSNGGKVNNSNGYDIVFYSDAGLTTLLDFERVYWDATTGTVEFWIRIPTLTSASATVIYLAYGNTSISTDQQNMGATWNTNYQGVWHLPDGTTLTANDSSGNGNNGTLLNTPTAISGKIDGAVNLASASSETINMGNVIDFTTNDFTIELWYRSSSGASGYLLFKGASNSGQYIVYVNTPGYITLYLQTNNSNWKQILDDSNNTFDGQWHHFIGVRSGTSNPTLTIYIDGAIATAPVTQSSGTVGSLTNTGDLTFSNSISFYNGDLDEVRILNAIPANIADWASTSYSNQNDPANFYTIGTETPA